MTEVLSPGTKRMSVPGDQGQCSTGVQWKVEGGRVEEVGTEEADRERQTETDRADGQTGGPTINQSPRPMCIAEHIFQELWEGEAEAIRERGSEVCDVEYRRERTKGRTGYNTRLHNTFT